MYARRSTSRAKSSELRNAADAGVSVVTGDSGWLQLSARVLVRRGAYLQGTKLQAVCPRRSQHSLFVSDCLLWPGCQLRLSEARLCGASPGRSSAMREKLFGRRSSKAQVIGPASTSQFERSSSEIIENQAKAAHAIMPRVMMTSPARHHFSN